MIQSIVFVMLLLLPSYAWSAIAEVGGGSQRATCNVANADSISCAYPGNVTANSLLVVSGGQWHTSPQTVVVTGSGAGCSSTTFSNLNSSDLAWGGGTGRAYINYGIAAGSAACTADINPGGASNYISAHIDEFSGVDTSVSLDVDGGSSSGTSATSSDSITTSVANALIVAAMISSDTNTITPGAGYTAIGESESSLYQPNAAEFRIVTTATSYTADWTLGATEPWTAMTASFRPSGVAVTPSGMMLRGIGR